MARKVSERAKNTTRFKETQKRVSEAIKRYESGRSSGGSSSSGSSSSSRSSSGSSSSGSSSGSSSSGGSSSSDIIVIKGGTVEKQQQVADALTSGQRSAPESGQINISDKAPILQRIAQQEQAARRVGGSSSTLSPGVQQLQDTLTQANGQAPQQRQVQQQPGQMSSTLSPAIQEFQQTITQPPREDGRQFTQQVQQPDFTPMDATREQAADREQMRQAEFIQNLEQNREQAKQTIGESFSAFTPFSPVTPLATAFFDSSVNFGAGQRALLNDINSSGVTLGTTFRDQFQEQTPTETFSTLTEAQIAQAQAAEASRIKQQAEAKQFQATPVSKNRDYTQEFINTFGDLQNRAREQEFGVASPLVGTGSFFGAAGGQVVKSFVEEPAKFFFGAIKDPLGTGSQVTGSVSEFISDPQSTIASGGASLGELFQTNPGAAFGLTAGTILDLQLGFRSFNLAPDVTVSTPSTATRTTGDVLTTSRKAADDTLDITSAQTFRTIDEQTRAARVAEKEFTIIDQTETTGAGVVKATGRSDDPLSVSGKVTSKQKVESLLVEGSVKPLSDADYNKLAQEVLDVAKDTPTSRTTVTLGEQIRSGSGRTGGGGGRRVDTFITGTVTDTAGEISAVTKNADKISRDILQTRSQPVQKGKASIDFETEFFRQQEFIRQPPKQFDIQKTVTRQQPDTGFLTKDIKVRRAGDTTITQTQIERSFTGDLLRTEAPSFKLDEFQTFSGTPRPKPKPATTEKTFRVGGKRLTLDEAKKVTSKQYADLLRKEGNFKAADIQEGKANIFDDLIDKPSQKGKGFFPDKKGQAFRGMRAKSSLDIPTPTGSVKSISRVDIPPSRLTGGSSINTRIPFLGKSVSRLDVNLRTPSPFKVRTPTGFSLTPSSRLVTGTSSSLAIDSLLKPRSGQDILSRTNIAEDTILKDRTPQITDTDTRLKEDTITDTDTSLRSRTTSITRAPSPITGTFTPKKPEEPFRRLRLPRPKPQKKPSAKSFFGEAKINGQWQQVSRVPTTKNNALRVAGFAVDNNPARSIRVRGTQLKPQKPVRPRLPSLTQFRKSKSTKGILVEKSKFAINSPGEKRKITDAGLKALRNTRRFNF